MYHPHMHYHPLTCTTTPSHALPPPHIHVPHLHPQNSHITEKRVFLDVIIEDDQGEVEEVIVPYQLSNEAVVLEMKVQDMKVNTERGMVAWESTEIRFLFIIISIKNSRINVCTLKQNIICTHTHTHIQTHKHTHITHTHHTHTHHTHTHHTHTHHTHTTHICT